MGEYMKRSEYISREAAHSEACKGCSIDFPCEPCEPQNCEIKARLEAIPAADVVEVRHGRWTWDGGEDMHYYCSLCHHNAYGNTGEVLDGEYKYCPFCGARMDGGMDNG